jgi:hypothetical protein
VFAADPTAGLEQSIQLRADVGGQRANYFPSGLIDAIETSAAGPLTVRPPPRTPPALVLSEAAAVGLRRPDRRRRRASPAQIRVMALSEPPDKIHLDLRPL